MADERDELDVLLDQAQGEVVAHHGLYARNVTRARTIRARERRLAELAHELIMDRRRSVGWEPDALDRRYEEACK